MDITSSTALIKEWAKTRGLDIADPTRQMLKLIEEVGELGASMARNLRDEEADAIGDIYVVLTILAMQLGFDVEQCVADAYKVIQYRKGTMQNGVFVKE
jgi:NTP pyrophosphatase (non-canonical NTP hydrolase)